MIYKELPVRLCHFDRNNSNLCTLFGRLKNLGYLIQHSNPWELSQIILNFVANTPCRSFAFCLFLKIKNKQTTNGQNENVEPSF